MAAGLWALAGVLLGGGLSLLGQWWTIRHARERDREAAAREAYGGALSAATAVIRATTRYHGAKMGVGQDASAANVARLSALLDYEEALVAVYLSGSPEAIRWAQALHSGLKVAADKDPSEAWGPALESHARLLKTIREDLGTGGAIPSTVPQWVEGPSPVGPSPEAGPS